MNEKYETMVNKLGLSKDHPMTEKVWSAISFFLSDQQPQNDFGNINGGNSALDIFSSLLSKRLKYENGEKDMVAMHHEFGIEHSSGKKVIAAIYMCVKNEILMLYNQYYNRKHLHPQ
jgi:alpha-aminoadipic semialdehyde synthase